MAPSSKAVGKKPAKGQPTATGKSTKPTGSEPERWTRLQIDALDSQKKAASWLEDSHSWHQTQLSKLLELLEDGGLAQVPQEVREAVEFYVSQAAEGVDQDAFYDDQEIYGDLLTEKEEKQEVQEAPYERPPETPEALEAVQRIFAWEDTSVHGISRFEQIWKAFPASPALQEAGITRFIGFLLRCEGAVRGAATQGLKSPRAVSLVLVAMERCPRDPLVQSRGCAALMHLSKAPGDLFTVLQAGASEMIVKVLRDFMTNYEIASTALKCLHDIVNRSPENSPEISIIAKAVTIETVAKVKLYHASTPMERTANVMLPFLR